MHGRNERTSSTVSVKAGPMIVWSRRRRVLVLAERAEQAQRPFSCPNSSERRPCDSGVGPTALSRLRRPRHYRSIIQ